MPLFKKKETASETVEETSKKGVITVEICGRENGLETFENIKYVRVISKSYNLLIMEDYLPIIGDIDGSISFRDDEKEIVREGIVGYFMHKSNKFSLLIKNTENTKTVEI